MVYSPEPSNPISSSAPSETAVLHTSLTFSDFWLTFPSKLTPLPTPTQTHRHAQASRQLLHCLTRFHLFQSWRENSCFRITPESRTKLLPPTGCLCFLCLDWEGDFRKGEKKVVTVCFYFVWSFVFPFFFFLFLGWGDIFSDFCTHLSLKSV